MYCLSCYIYSLSIVCLKVDHFACGGIDQLTEKVPQLKDATPKLIEETKVIAKKFVKVVTSNNLSLLSQQYILETGKVTSLTFLCFRVQ